MMSIGNRLKKLREERGLTQEELGKIVGVSDKAVSTWENDIKVPRNKRLQNLADFFNVSVDFLLGRSDKQVDDSVIEKVLDIEDDLLKKYGNIYEAQKASQKNDSRKYIIITERIKIALSLLSKEEQEKLLKISTTSIPFKLSNIDITSINPKEAIKKLVDLTGLPMEWLTGEIEKLPSGYINSIRHNENDISILYNQLDDVDKAEIRGEIRGMLKAEKYNKLSISEDIAKDFKKIVDSKINTKSE